MGAVESVSADKITALKNALKSTDRSIFRESLDKLVLLTKSTDNVKLMGSENHRLFEDVVAILRDSSSYNDDDKDKCLEVLCSLSTNSDVAVRMGSDDLGLIKLLADILKSSSNPKLLAKSLLIFKTLSVNDDIEERMSSSNIGLVDLLINIAKNDKASSDTRMNALSILKNLTLDSDTKVRIVTSNLGFTEMLLKMIKSDKSNEVLSPLHILWSLSGDPKSSLSPAHYEIVSKLGSSNLGVVDCMLSIITNKIKIVDSIKNEAKILAFKVIWFLSRNKDNRIRLGSPKLPLIDLLMNTVKEVPISNCQLYALLILQNLATNSGTNGPNRMSAEKAMFLEALQELLKKSDKSKDLDIFNAVLGTLRNLSKNNECQRRLGSDKLELVELFTNIVKVRVVVGSDIQVDKSDQKNASIAIDILFNISMNKFNEARMAKPELGLINLLVEIIIDKRSELRNKALGIIWNLSADSKNQETFGGQSPFKLIDILLDIARTEIDSDCGLKSLSALKNFSVCKNNKVHMCSANMVGFLTEILRRGVSDINTSCLECSLAILTNISLSNINKQVIGTKKCGIIDGLIAILRNENLSVSLQIKVLNILWNLSLSLSVKNLMASNTLGMIDVIIDMFVENRYKCNLAPKDKALYFEANGKALSILWNISLPTANIILMELHQNFSIIGYDKVGFLRLLINLIKVDTGDAKLIALKTLFNLCRSRDMKVKMVAAELIPFMQLYSNADNESEEVKNTAYDIIFSLKHDTSQVDIGDKDLLDNYHDEEIKHTNAETVAQSVAIHQNQDVHHEIDNLNEDLFHPDHITEEVNQIPDQQLDNDLFDSHAPHLHNLQFASDYYDGFDDHEQLLWQTDNQQEHSRRPSIANSTSLKKGPVDLSGTLQEFEDDPTLIYEGEENFRDDDRHSEDSDDDNYLA